MQECNPCAKAVNKDAIAAAYCALDAVHRQSMYYHACLRYQACWLGRGWGSWGAGISAPFMSMMQHARAPRCCPKRIAALHSSTTHAGIISNPLSYSAMWNARSFI